MPAKIPPDDAVTTALAMTARDLAKQILTLAAPPHLAGAITEIDAPREGDALSRLLIENLDNGGLLGSMRRFLGGGSVAKMRAAIDDQLKRI